MSLINENYWELTVEINPVCCDVLCDIIQSEFDCRGIITAEEKYKNLELVSTTENNIKAYIVADKIEKKEIERFFLRKKQELIDNNVFDSDIGSWRVSIRKQENVDWSKKWKEHWKPEKISDHIVICPSWEKYNKKDNEIVITLDPGNAFGTGAHATTRLCVAAMEKYMKKGDIAADIGCGSGILSICAMRSGAKETDAVDIDETAVETAKLNAEKNNVNINFMTASSDILPSEKYDFVFANILHNILAQNMPDLKRIMKNNAKIVLSGILKEKEKVVFDAIEENKLKVEETMQQNEWIAIVAAKEE